MFHVFWHIREGVKDPGIDGHAKNAEDERFKDIRYFDHLFYILSSFYRVRGFAFEELRYKESTINKSAAPSKSAINKSAAQAGGF
jgi:hypothetical protein